MIEIPNEFNYLEIYLTLRCNLACPYCVNKYGALERHRTELCGDEWLTRINRINFNKLPLTIGGGEPTLHPDFYYIINNIRKDIQIDLLTNLSFDAKEFTKRINAKKFNRNPNPAYKSIRVSYHASQSNGNELTDKVQFLQSKGFQIGIFGINHPEHIEANIAMSELARTKNVYFFIKDFLGYYEGRLFGYYKYNEALDGIPKPVRCRTHELLIAPGGNMYRCHHDLYSKQGSLGKLGYDNFIFKYRNCKYFGLCNPCDVKNKSNRFLQMGNCNMEIE
jgi:MoaA/NifB/PqqE/SkfB family radical SAM enzyme